MTKQRRRFKQTESFQARLAAFAQRLRQKASRLPAGLEKEGLLRRARQADTATHIDGWLNSAGLQPPK